MKRTLLTGILLFVFAAGIMAAENPIDKGSIMLGGSIYFESMGGDAYKPDYDPEKATTTIGLMPEVGYFIAPSIMVGAIIDWTNAKDGDYKQNDMAFGPMVGYFFNMNSAEVKGSVYPYVIGLFQFGSVKTETPGEVDQKNNLMRFGGKGGIMYMLTETVALNVNVMYTSDSWKQKEPVEADESITGTVLKIGVGVQAFVF